MDIAGRNHVFACLSLCVTACLFVCLYVCVWVWSYCDDNNTLPHFMPVTSQSLDCKAGALCTPCPKMSAKLFLSKLHEISTTFDNFVAQKWPTHQNYVRCTHFQSRFISANALPC